MRRVAFCFLMVIGCFAYGAAPTINNDEIDILESRALNDPLGFNRISMDKIFSVGDGEDIKISVASCKDGDGNAAGSSTVLKSCEAGSVVNGSEKRLVIRALSRGIAIVELEAENVSDGNKKSKVQLVLQISPPDPVNDINDYRKPFNIDLFVGFINNSFSPSQRARYLNDDDLSGTDTSGSLDIQFDYKFLEGTKDSDGNYKSLGQLWLFGNTIRIRRTAEFECSDINPNPTCANFADDPADIINEIQAIQDQGFSTALAFLKNARSIEGYLGIRGEKNQILKDTRFRSRLYWAARAGFASVEGVEDLVGLHQITFGFMANGNSNFRGTFLEVGYGVNELYIENQEKRFVFNTRFMYAPKGTLLDFGGNISYFIESNLDADFGSGPDSIRTRGGIEINL